MSNSTYETWSHENCRKARHALVFNADGSPRLDNYVHPRPKYIEKLKAMDMRALESQCEQMIWLSAYAANNGRSDYHWQCDACYDELMERTKSDQAYANCHKRVSATL